MSETNKFDYRIPLQNGLIAGVVALSVSVIGMVTLFAQRYLIAGWLTLGQVILFMAPAAMSYLAAGKAPQNNKGIALIYGFLTGLISALPLVLLILLNEVIDLRQFLPNVSPALIEILTFGRGTVEGSLLLITITSILGLVAAGLYLLPDRIRRPIFSGLIWVFFFGMFSEILSDRLRTFFGTDFVKLIIKSKALRPVVAVTIFIVTASLSALWSQRGDKVKGRMAKLDTKSQTRMRNGLIVLGITLMLILPLLLGTYL
ncbi:MAG TPA: hypothetical protein VMV80_08395, partial [Anaerolineales bacterium]|nr:hypothetical protein [Anaerolineales bacterium]